VWERRGQGVPVPSSAEGSNLTHRLNACAPLEDFGHAPREIKRAALATAQTPPQEWMSRADQTTDYHLAV
jgi:hypothetical protein